MVDKQSFKLLWCCENGYKHRFGKTKTAGGLSEKSGRTSGGICTTGRGLRGERHARQ